MISFPLSESDLELWRQFTNRLPFHWYLVYFNTFVIFQNFLGGTLSPSQLR